MDTALSMQSMEAFRRLASDFPCLIPIDNKCTAIAGFLRVQGREFRLVLRSDCSSLDVDNNLKKLLQARVQHVQNKLKLANDPHDLLVELRDLIERELTQNDVERKVEGMDKSLPPAHFYERLLSDISKVGWKCVLSMNESMQSLDLSVTDDANRKHVVGFALPPDYPVGRPQCVTSLPVDFESEWGRDSTLLSVVEQFRKVVNQYSDFFRAMEDIDENTWVLEPEYPTTRETYRRIALDKHCSMRIEIDPRAPLKGFPDIRFLGSQAAIGPFKERLNQNIQLWDMSGNSLPRKNLERVLAISLPTREKTDNSMEEEMSLECGICYSYRLEDTVPDVACDLPECSKPYHRACLVDWLRALPDTRESFGTIRGTCVYCENAISVATAAD